MDPKDYFKSRVMMPSKEYLAKIEKQDQIKRDQINREKAKEKESNRLNQRKIGTDLINEFMENDGILDVTQENSVFLKVRMKQSKKWDSSLINSKVLKISTHYFLYLAFSKPGNNMCNSETLLSIEPIDFLYNITPDLPIEAVMSNVSYSFKIERVTISGYPKYNLIADNLVIHLKLHSLSTTKINDKKI